MSGSEVACLVSCISIVRFVSLGSGPSIAFVTRMHRDPCHVMGSVDHDTSLGCLSIRHMVLGFGLDQSNVESFLPFVVYPQRMEGVFVFPPSGVRV